MNRRSAMRRAAVSMLAFSASDAVFAQQGNWPVKPITLMVPGAAGSGVDLLARELATRLAAVLKQNIIVDNKPGASGAIATQAVVRSAPDGHTLLYSNAGNTVIPASLVKTLPYDVLRDIVPVAQTVAGGIFLLTSNDVPATNLGEFLRYVKANPGKLSYGTSGVGSTGHLIMEWFKRRTGMDITHVPYRVAGQMLTEMVGGSLKVCFLDAVSPLPFIEAHKIRAIAVTGAVRLPRSPSVPTMGEQGHPFETVGWFGVFAPAGTPRDIVQRLSDEINRIQAQPDVIARVKSLNMTLPPVGSPEQFRKLVVNDLSTWKRIVAETGITMEN